MKIVKQLKLNSIETKLSEDNIVLELDTPGRCVLTVVTTVKPNRGELIELNGQLNTGDLRRLFYGFIESVTPQQNNVFKIVGRELAALLNQRIVLNLRHVTPANVLKEISLKTNLQFILPKSPWTKTTISRFQHIGGGYMALDYILKLWGVYKGVWQQQADGQIYIGESIKSVPGQKRISLDASMFTQISVQGGTLPLIPRLRPGVQIQFSDQVLHINRVEITNETMRLNWLQNPWDKHLKAIQ